MITGIGFALFFYQAESTDHSGKIRNNTAIRNDRIGFKTQMIPLLQKKCSPCHFAGGKMYAKMPFDNPATILSHQTGILKRMKEQPAAALIKQFVQQHGNEN